MVIDSLFYIVMLFCLFFCKGDMCGNYYMWEFGEQSSSQYGFIVTSQSVAIYVVSL